MSLHPHWGHRTVLRALARAHLEGSLPASLLLHGRWGVGKRHLALWLAQLVLCPSAGPEGPCGTCDSCRKSGSLKHPDLHWYFPLPRPKQAGNAEKLEKALEEARAAELESFRKSPLRVPDRTNEPRALYLAAIRNLRRRALMRPVEGERQVFLISQAEALAPNESSSEAANALLKILEEPPHGTLVLLTAAEPGRLLPTIRSRTSQIHLPPLSRDEVREFLIRVADASPETAERASAYAQGSIGRALGFLPDDDGPGPLEELRLEAHRWLAAALAPGPEQAFRRALEASPTGARGLGEFFDFLEEALRDLALAALSTSPERTSPLALELQEALDRAHVHPAGVARAMKRLGTARRLAAGNVNPQLLFFGLLRELGKDLIAPPRPSAAQAGGGHTAAGSAIAEEGPGRPASSRSVAGEPGAGSPASSTVPARGGRWGGTR